MSEPVSDDQVRQAVQRWWQGSDDPRVVVSSTLKGALITAYREGLNSPAGRIYIHADTGTVYSVPSWVSGAAAMDRAVQNPAKRARLAVL